MKAWDRSTLRRQWPLAALVFLAMVFSMMMLFSRKAPVISDIHPSIAAPGDTVTLIGDYFGRTAREGQLTISGLTPPPSVITEWSDQRIVFQVPSDAPSGLVTVSNSQGISSSVLFTNSFSVPTVLKSRPETPELEITYVLPSSPVPGQLVTLGGRGFGRADNGSWLTLTAPMPSGETISQDISPYQTISWSDQSIQFYLPSGWGDKTVSTVHNAKGFSTPLALNPSTPVVLESLRTYHLNFPLEITVNAGSGNLTILPPLPQGGLNLSAKPQADPLQFTSVSQSLSTHWRLTMTVASRRWQGWKAGVEIPLDLPIPPGPALPENLWTSVPGSLKTLSQNWGLDAPDDFLRTKHLLTALRAGFHRAAMGTPNRTNAASLLSSRMLNPWEAATLSAVVGKQAGLVVRLVRGFYLGESGNLTAHVWVRVWISGASWIDIDPWLVLDSAEGSVDAEVGGFDNRHLPWATDKVYPVRLAPSSRPVSGVLPFTTQTLLAEVTDSLELGSVSWGTPVLEASAAP